MSLCVHLVKKAHFTLNEAHFPERDFFFLPPGQIILTGGRGESNSVQKLAPSNTNNNST